MPARPAKPTLLAVAAPAEARAVLRALGADESLASESWRPIPLSPRFTLLITGIGKVNAAAAVARFADQGRHAAVLTLGVAGSLPGSNLNPGDAIAATASIYADEGLQTDDAFLDCAAMGFSLLPQGGRWPPPAAAGGGSASTSSTHPPPSSTPASAHQASSLPGSSFPPDPALLALLRTLADAAGPIATVSTCSGTDALAAMVRARTAALAEAMEGAAVLHTAARLALPAAELRTISNTCGHRPSQRWDLTKALARLESVVRGLSP